MSGVVLGFDTSNYRTSAAAVTLDGEILADYRARGGEVVTVEPHLRVFDGLQGLEQGTGPKRAMPAGVYATADEAFDTACNALRKLI